ncbi:MAG: zinc ribbon domain-containing protein [Clostridia bacterium]|nr:zinc ribbon domain-containing protein [Clostridia bacterium]
MKCSKCGNELNDKDEFCTKCGEKIKIKENNIKIKEDINTSYINKKTNKNIVILKVVVFIIAVVVVIMFFNGAESVENAGMKMSNLRSVGGETVAEAYYQYYGTFLGGLSTVIKGLGITCGVIILYIGSKLKVYEDNKNT